MIYGYYREKFHVNHYLRFNTSLFPFVFDAKENHWGKSAFYRSILKRGHILRLSWKLFGHNKVSHNSFARSFNRKSFKLAFELLQGAARTGCQSIIVFATDGVDNDGDPVRCGPGYYTRSGYVPGQICKYDWNDVWDEVLAKNRYMIPRVRNLLDGFGTKFLI